MSDKTLNILVVDDDSVSRQMVRRLLDCTPMKFELEEAQTVKEAVHILSDRKFDIALLDFRLPDGNAISVLKTLRKYGRLHTPIIVFTAHAAPESADEAVLEGAQDYLPKEEITPDNLERAIRYSMQRHHLTHELLWSRERERREKELRLLQSSVTESGAAPNPVKDLPETFERFVRTYEKLLLQSLDEAGFRTAQEVPDLARRLAHDLGDLHAGPKDVIDIHTAAMKRVGEKTSTQREQAIAEEARILLVQLMGFLVLHYRKSQIDRPRMQKPSMDA
ncbi:MAG: response regulator [Cyanobacteria bacterium SZAS-4]|nr:response regulator [Cyanobacteria bacterium SZAS-4]